MKRQMCVRKAMGDTSGAIKCLNDYLKLFMGDVDAWQELAELYIDQQMYAPFGNITILGTRMLPTAMKK